MAIACGRSSSNRWSPGRSPTPARPATRVPGAANAARAAAREAGHEFGIALGAVVSGLAALEDGDLDAAAAALAEARASADREPAAMEWMLRAPLHLGCAAVALARDDPAGAAAEVDAAARLAAQASEPTYTALAAALRARVAHARGDRGGVAAALTAARAAARNASPIAAARVEAVAATLGEGQASDPYATLREALNGATGEVAATFGVAGSIGASTPARRKRGR